MRFSIILPAIALLTFAGLTGCKKDDSPVTPVVTTSDIFTTSNVKTKPVYFSFASKDSVASTAAWDLKLTTVFAPDDSLRQFPFPGIVLNANLNVLGTYVDGADFSTVDAASVTGLKRDIIDTLASDSTRNIKTAPVYYSFDQRDTTSSTGNWDIKMTVNTFLEPLIILNTGKGVSGKVLDNSDFATMSAAVIPTLESDVNDTTLVIGNKCLLYDPTTHRLNPIANRVFVIRTINGARVKFRMLNYYNGAGASGYMQFQYVAPERYSIGSFCLNYNSTTHHLDPYANRTFFVQTTGGKRAKFKMLTYYNEQSVSGFMKFEYVVQ